MGMFSSFDINASGLTAQRYRMDVIAENAHYLVDKYKKQTITCSKKKSNSVWFGLKLISTSCGC